MGFVLSLLEDRSRLSITDNLTFYKLYTAETNRICDLDRVGWVSLDQNVKLKGTSSATFVGRPNRKLYIIQNIGRSSRFACICLEPDASSAVYNDDDGHAPSLASARTPRSRCMPGASHGTKV